MRKKLFFLILAILVFAVSSTASAAFVPKMDYSELVEKTSYIFVGTVTDVSYNSHSTDPQTLVTFEVELELMGQHGNEITFVLPEGPFDDGTFLDITGTTQFIEDHSYLLFIRAGEWYMNPVTNWFHSSFRTVSVDGSDYFVNHVGHCIRDINESDAFELGAMIEPALEWETTPGHPDTGIRARVSSHDLSESEIKQNAGTCMTVQDVTSYLQGTLPNEPKDPTLTVEPNRPLSTILKDVEFEFQQ
jgi:hypothetical protein